MWIVERRQPLQLLRPPSTILASLTQTRRKSSTLALYSDGLAFDWYENLVDQNEEPDLFHYWTPFRFTLDYHFGEISPSHAAERKIRSLNMADRDAVNNYITKCDARS